MAEWWITIEAAAVMMGKTEAEVEQLVQQLGLPTNQEEGPTQIPRSTVELLIQQERRKREGQRGALASNVAGVSDWGLSWGCPGVVVQVVLTFLLRRFAAN